MAPLTIGFSEAKAKLSQLTEEINRTGQSVMVYKRNKPWVTIVPAAPGVPGGDATQEAMAEAEQMLADPNTKYHQDAESMFRDLGL